MLRIYNAVELIETIHKYNQVICFGAGEYFRIAGQIFGGTPIWDKVKYVVDNDKKKQGTDILINGQTIRIISLEELALKNIGNQSVMLITSYMYTDIIHQVRTCDSLKNIDLICMSHTLAIIKSENRMNVYMPHDIRRTEQPMIPKKIHYCWFGGKKIPDKYKYCIDSWHRYCPDYEIIEWNENNVNIAANQYMQQAYDNEKWAFVPDYARLDIIYNHGGIYLDTDVELLRNIDDLLYQKGFAGFETEEFVALGLGFGAVKGLPIIKKMRDMYDGLKFVDYNGNIDLTASPKWQTKVLKEHGLCTNGEYQVIEDLTIYPVKVLNGRAIFNHSNDGTYPKSVHHYELSSWQEKKYIDFMKVFDEDIKGYFARMPKS